MIRVGLFFILLFCIPLMVQAQSHAQPQNLLHEEGGEDDAKTALPPTSTFSVPPATLNAPHHEARVEKNELPSPVLNSMGILDETNSGAFAPIAMDIWKQNSYSDAIAALDNATKHLQTGRGNDVMRHLTRLVALSKTYEPAGGAEHANGFMRARVMAAQASGERERALQLLSMRSEAFDIEEWKNFAQSDMRMGRVVDACALMSEKFAQDSSASTQKLAIICDIVGKKPDTARLHLDVLRETGDADALFFELAERALNPSVKTKGVLKFQDGEVRHLALLAVGGIKLKPEIYDGLLGEVRPVLLQAPLSDTQRLKLAEQLTRSGWMSAAEYTAQLERTTFPAKAIATFRANPSQILTVPEKEWPAALRRAAAIKAMHEESNEAQKAHIIASALPGYSNADLLGTMGDILQQEVSGLAALPDNLAAAPMMARLLLLRGDKNAQSWWRMASASSTNRTTLLPLFPLALLRGVIGEEERGAWFESYGRLQSFSAERKSYHLALIKTLGVMMPSDVDSQIAAQGIFPAQDARDKTVPGMIDNLMKDTQDSTLRAVLALRALRQNKLAEMLVLSKL